MDKEFFLQYELRLRMLDYKIKLLEESSRRDDNKFNTMLGIIVASVLIPIGLHFYKLV